jgi:tRNA (guanine-N7-)-methyltransferase
MYKFFTMTKILNDYPEVSLKVEDLTGKIDFSRIFGRSNPVNIEIGSGKGAFLLNQAKALPFENFLGIEQANKFYRFSVDRIGRWALSNVRIIRTDAAAFMAESIPDESVDCFHIYFPDPWPKRKHYRRRFICPANLDIMIRCLKNGGRIQIATDHADYFEQIKILLNSESDKLEQSEFTPAAGAQSGEWLGTNYERKYLNSNRQIYTIAVKKISESKK